MFVRNRNVPENLRVAARQVDQLSGIGNRDGGVTETEVSQAIAAASPGTASPGTASPTAGPAPTSSTTTRPDAASSVHPDATRVDVDSPNLDPSALTALARHLESLSGEGDQSNVRADGPDGPATSTVFPAIDGIQRERIEFPAGQRIGRGAIELPRALEGAGVVAARITLAGTSTGAALALPRVTIGGSAIAPNEPRSSGRPPSAPLHGPIMMQADRDANVASVDVFYHVPSVAETTDEFPINRTIHAGETYELALSPYRSGQGIDQIESIWTASYSVPDPSGRRSEEDKPFYMDGVYCDTYLVNEAGEARKIDRTRFVDANEVDNAHDLGGPTAEKLQLRFFARSPEGENHPITLRGVRVRYVADPSSSAASARFEIGRIIEPGGVAEIELPPALRGRKIGRVEVRWTDMLSGTWTRPGYASGQLVVDGRRVGAQEGVQSPETQTFSYLGGVSSDSGKIGVAIDDDRARVDWISVYFED
ncbi:MAG: hypothetical protein H6729_16805 [Deltaproteobacteria bacterium]|nr:hypothetical protein [Deltaproteobacteria bacterium]